MALDVSEKQKMQLTHSLGEPRPPGMAPRNALEDRERPTFFRN